MITYILYNLHKDITVEALSDELHTSTATVNRWRKLGNDQTSPPKHILDENYLKAFQTYKGSYFDDSPSKIVDVIITMLQNNHVSDMEVDKEISEYNQNKEGYSDEQFEAFVRLLLKKASYYYLKKEKTPKVETPKQVAEQENTEIRPRSVADLKNMGLTSMDIAAQLMANDAALYSAEVLGSNAGSTENWASQIEAAPDNWFLLCEGKKIIGNWSMTFLSPEEEQLVRKGDFGGDDFSLKNVNYPVTAADKEVTIFILNISLNSGYQTNENWNTLWSNFGKRIQQLNNVGITVKGIYAGLFLPRHVHMFKLMGFDLVGVNKISGDIYYLDLSKPSLANFGWIMPEPEENEKERKIVFRQLSNDDVLDDQQYADLCGLLYDTDKYISPALFSREQAKEVLPMVFASNDDPMFCLDNIFCAMDRNRIVGVLLHKRGPLNWSADTLLHYASLLDVTLPDTVRMVEEKYFRSYNKTAEDTTAILNCCVNSNYRMKSEIRLGTRMMEAFQKQHTERLELYVLKETSAAFRMYLKTGFKTEDQYKCNGFSVDNHKLPCYFMYRPAQK